MRSPILNEADYRRNEEEYGALRYTRGEFRGIVVENRDPMGLGRCKVRAYSLHGDDQAIADRDLPWAYPKTDMAGADSGSFDVPDKGARVWLWFEQGDVNHPVYGGGWVVAAAGQPDAPPPSPLAEKAANAAKKTAEAAQNLTHAADSVTDAAKAAQSAMSALDAVTNTVATAATAVVTSITGLMGSILGGTGGSGSGLADGESYVTFDQDAIRELVQARAKTARNHDKLGQTVGTISVVVQEVDDLAPTVDSAIADVEVANDESLKVANQLVSDGGQEGEDPIVKTAVALKENAGTLSQNSEQLGGALSALGQACSGTVEDGVRVQGTSAKLIETADAALNIANLSGTPYLNPTDATAALQTLAHKAQGLIDRLSSRASGGSSAASAIKSALSQAKDARAATKSAAADAKTAQRRVLAKIVKVMGKKEPDPGVYPARPEPFNDKPWPVSAGSEVSRESQQMANNTPTVKTWRKSSKGHTMLCDDQDGKERMAFIDRAGNAIYFECGVLPVENESNQEQRGLRSALDGDPVEREKMRNMGSKIGMLDQAQSKIEMDSRLKDEKIVIIANDGDGGIENGRSRQRIELSAGGNHISIESVQDGEVNAKVLIDANSGAVIIEAARMVTVEAPYITLNADHINLNGRVNVTGDMCVSGRLTGGGS